MIVTLVYTYRSKKNERSWKLEVVSANTSPFISGRRQVLVSPWGYRKEKFIR